MPIYFRPERFLRNADAEKVQRIRHCRGRVQSAREEPLGSLIFRDTRASALPVPEPKNGWTAFLRPAFRKRAGAGSRPCLRRAGRLRGDLTVLNWGRGEWWIRGSYYLREWHMRWFNDLAEPGVTVEDLSDRIVGFAVVGPKSRELLSSLTHHEVSGDALPFMGLGEMDLV